jgi:O-antigen/teichoic acid export membrane protein
MIPFGANGAFHPVEAGGELRRVAVRSAAAALSAATLSLGLRVVSTVTLARLLTPADFGVVTMVTTVSLLLTSFGLNGFTEAVIQFEEMDHYTASNLFWLNCGAGFVLAIALAAGGAPLAHFYRNPLAANVAVGLSVAVFIAPTSVIHLALLKRGMGFTSSSANDVIALAVYTAVTIVLAAMGWGYWALVGGMVANQLSLTIGAWWLVRWIPSLPRRTGKTAAAVRFAAKVYGQFSLRYSTRNVDNLLVGWQFNAVALGFYKKAFDLFALSASQLTAPMDNVALAALSRLNQDPERFRRYFANALGIIAFVGMAVSADLTLVGRDVVRVLLGPQWSESGRIFQLFGPGIGAMLLASTVGWIHLSIGTPGRWLRWTILEFAITASMFIVALPWGPKGVAAAWSLSYCILLIPAFWYAGRPIGFGVSILIGAVWRYAAASLLAGAATAAIFRRTVIWSSPEGVWVALKAAIILSLTFVALYLGAVVLLHWSFAPFRQLASLLRELGPRRSAASPALEPVGECK